MAANVDSDIYNKFVLLPDNIRRDVLEWFRGSKQVSIFITGKTGVGKSTLVNGLVGAELAKEGDTLDPETAKVTCYEKEFYKDEKDEKDDALKVTVWDSPGLQDGTTKEAEYLADMKEKCSDMDICIYCVNFMEVRFTKDCADVVAMKKLTEVFGKKMWENAMFVLTFANMAEDIDSEILEAEDGQKPELFQAKIQLWKDTVVSTLISDVGIDKEVADRIEVVPAGYATQPALLDRDHWLSPVWFAALYAMNPRAQPAMMKLNFGRIIDNPDEIRQEDLEKFIHEQPVIFSKRGAIVGANYGEGEVGKAIGCKMGEGASVNIRVILELHAAAMEMAKQLNQAFMEFIERIMAAKKSVEDK